MVYMPDIVLFAAKKGGKANGRIASVLDRFGGSTVLTEGIISKAVEDAAGKKPHAVDLSDYCAVSKAKGDVALVSINTVDAFRYLAAMKEKIRNNFGTVVVGGQLPSMMPGVFQRFMPSASVFSGECEESMEMVVKDAQLGKHGLLYKAKPVDIEKNYVLFDRDFGRTLQPMEIGRGCTYSCQFCGMPPNMRKPRIRDIAQVKEEMGPLKTILFVDPNLSSYPKEYLWEVFSDIERKGKRWGGEATAKELVGDPELWNLMSRTCIILLNGVEDLNGDVSAARKNGGSLLSEPNGAVVLRSMIIGDTNESAETINATIRAFREKNLTGVFHLLAPLPGSPQFRKLEREGRIVEKDLAKYDRRHSVLRGDNLSPGEVESLFRKVNRSAHTFSGTVKEIIRILGDSADFGLAFDRVVTLVAFRTRALAIGLEREPGKKPGNAPELLLI